MSESRFGLPPECAANSFTNDDLEGMIIGNNPISNAYRELLAYRRVCEPVYQMACAAQQQNQPQNIRKNIPRPKGLKFKTPPVESKELDRMYEIAFAADSFFASWAGQKGHYAYDHIGYEAKNQDGYVYLWPMACISGYTWRISADPETARAMCPEYVEINL